MTSYQLLTVVVVLGTIAAIGTYDVWVWKKSRGPNDATISKLLLNAAKKYPIVAVAFGIAIGVLLGHLFWPQHIYH